MTLPVVSVIILSWNGLDYIESCLRSVLDQAYEPVEVIVVDNASSDGTPDLIAERFPSVKLIRNNWNAGYAVGNNIGLRAAHGEIKVLLNQDTEVEPGWLQAMVETMTADPAIGVVGCKIYYPGSDRMLQHAGGHVIFPDAAVEHFSKEEPDRGQQDTARNVEVVTGAAMGLRSKMLERIGLLDEGFSLYYEDVDLCFRARRAGYRVFYTPDARLTHIETASSERSSELLYRRFHTSRWRFMLKHYDLDDILSRSVEAERERLQHYSEHQRRVTAIVHLLTIANLPEILRAREAVQGTAVSKEKRERLEEALYRLRRDAWHVPEPDRVERSDNGPVEEPVVLEALRRKRHIQEQPFTSQVQYVGPLIARARDAFNRVSTRWYVLPLVQQQNVYNELVIQQVSSQVEWMKMHGRWTATHDRWIAAYGRWITAREREHVELLQRVNELEDQVTQLNRTVETLEARVARLEEPEKTPEIDFEVKDGQDG